MSVLRSSTVDGLATCRRPLCSACVLCSPSYKICFYSGILKSTFLKQWPFLDGFSWHCRSLLVRLQRCALQTCFLFRRKLMAGIRQMLNPAPKRRLSLFPSENGTHICRTVGNYKDCYSAHRETFIL